MLRNDRSFLFILATRVAGRAFVSRGAALGLLALLATTSCTSFVYKTVYNQADFLVMRELNRYFDLRDDQRDFLSDRVDRLHVWHRRTELPRYAAALREFRERFAAGLTSRDIDWLFARGDDFRDATYRRVYSDAFIFLGSLRKDQLGHLKAALNEANEEIVEKIQLSRAERLAKRREGTLEFLDDWSGGLTAQQSRDIAGLVGALPELDRSRLRYRRERQSEFLQKLPANGGDPEGLRMALRPWFFQPDRSRPGYYRSELQRWRSAFRTMALEIDARMDADQRRAIIERLNRVIADLDDLSRR
ncbi:MAG: DUF6279 family lipoprotein [Leptospirales bacterium]|jgi:hypothetical protein